MTQDSLHILLSLLAYSRDSGEVQFTPRIQDEEWQPVLQLARQHMVAPLLYHRLKSQNPGLPGDIMNELYKEQLLQVRKNIIMYQELTRLLHIFHGREIPVVVLKGAHLAEYVYDHIGLRYMCDLDLLVRKEALPRIEKELLALGGEPVEHNRVVTKGNFNFSYMLPPHGVRLEIHWNLHSPVYSSHIDSQSIWERVVPVTFGEAPALIMTPDDLLLYLCQHNAVHVDSPNLRMLTDIGEVIKRHGRQLDWQTIKTRAESWGILHALYAFLRLSREMLAAGINPEQLESLRPGQFNNDNFSLLQRTMACSSQIYPRLDATRAEAQVWGIKGVRGKLSFIGRRIFLPRDEMSLIYPPPPGSWRIFLYYPVRIITILAWYGLCYMDLVFRRQRKKKYHDMAVINQIKEIRTWLMSS